MAKRFLAATLSRERLNNSQSLALDLYFHFKTDEITLQVYMYERTTVGIPPVKAWAGRKVSKPIAIISH